MDGTDIIELDPEEVARYARQIARIVEKGYAPGSEELQAAANVYGTAFQFLTFRRGSDYALLLGRAAEAEALAQLELEADETIQGLIAGIHEKVSSENEKIE